MRFGSLVGFAALLISLYIVWRIRIVVFLGFGAIALATVINRLVRFLRRKLGMRRGFAVTLAVAIVLTVLGGMIALVVPPVVQQMQALALELPARLARLNPLIDDLREILPGPLVEELQDFGVLLDNVQAFTGQLFPNVFSFLYGTAQALIYVLILLFATVMFLVNPGAYRRGLILAFPAFYRDRMDEILDICETQLTAWAVGTLITMVAVGIMSFVGLWILGVPLPLANAVLAALLELIPNLGPTLSAVPPTILALVEEPWKAIAVIIWYIVLQQIESFVILPFVMKQQVSLLPAVTLLSVSAFAFLFGFAGVFLALPFLVVAQVCFEEVLVKDVMNHWRSSSKT